MRRIFIVTPAGAGMRNGNRHTALRWAQMLRDAGHRVNVAQSWQGETCDLLLALHARRSHSSIAAFRRKCPDKRLVVVLTGTDLYRDLPESREAHESLALADRLIVLQDAALRELSPALRRKTRVVFQSADPRLSPAPPADRFRIAVVGHLRAEKDPLRTAAALQHIPQPGFEVVHVGTALDPKLGRLAERWMRRDRRYRWLGGMSHGRALGWIARSHVLVVSSVMEGGANVIAEAARIGTPVLASRVSGNIGMLGRGYPGFFPLHDDLALAALLKRCSDQTFYRRLKRKMLQRRSRFAPAAERKALIAAIR
jgi:putative glycosyltransferase (TIGR04348 family)